MPLRPVSNPPNPWLTGHVEWLGPPPAARLEVFEDASREILSRNDSPDLGFTWSVNPYRGCQHACAYCYARPYHEYLGYGAGSDFESKLVIKPRAPELLRAAFARSGWRGETVAFAGATDAWQPLEASYRLTRRCLEVCLEHRNPVAIVTKAALLERDLDLLQALRRDASCSVCVSVPWMDEEVARQLEPLAPSPARRIRTLARLAEAGLDPTVLVAPTVPGLDDELPRVLAAAAAVGVRRAGWQLLRLPGPVAGIFAARLRDALPEQAQRVLQLVRASRGGGLDDRRFHRRFRGEGAYAETIAQLFRVTARRLGLDVASPQEARPGHPERPRDGATFRRLPTRQASLFPEPD
jgi:DNA repair photolyase